MVCIYCGRNTDIYNTRPKSRNPSVWRRRRCPACVAQFTTLELPDYRGALVVEGVRGKLYPFSRDKLFLSLYKALEYRHDAVDTATDLTETVIGRLLRTKKAPDGLLMMRDIAGAAYLTLKRFDPPAAHTYEAFHASALKDRKIRV